MTEPAVNRRQTGEVFLSEELAEIFGEDTIDAEER
jgi:hypothetical protein